MQKQSCLIYRGPSEIDGQPIIAALTFSKRNKKLGKMASLFIASQHMTKVIFPFFWAILLT